MLIFASVTNPNFYPFLPYCLLLSNWFVPLITPYHFAALSQLTITADEKRSAKFRTLVHSYLGEFFIHIYFFIFSKVFIFYLWFNFWYFRTISFLGRVLKMFFSEKKIRKQFFYSSIINFKFHSKFLKKFWNLHFWIIFLFQETFELIFLVLCERSFSKNWGYQLKLIKN